MKRAARSPRVVLDTNLVLSALVFAKGRSAALRHAWQRGACKPLASKATVAELIRVLAYPKFKLTPEEQEQLLSDYLPWCLSVRTPATPPTIPACRDPNDHIFLELAVTGKADFLVTGDQDLLSLRAEFNRPIVSAHEFLKSITDD